MKIMWYDEASFMLSEAINRYKSVYCSQDNICDTIETTLWRGLTYTKQFISDAIKSVTYVALFKKDSKIASTKMAVSLNI